MKSFSKPLGVILLVLGLLLVDSSTGIHAKNVRKPVVAGRFYPASPSELREIIDQLTCSADSRHIQIPTDKLLRAIILPHAGLTLRAL